MPEVQTNQRALGVVVPQLQANISDRASGYTVGRWMSAPRLKFQVWSDTHQRWRTAYCLITMLHENLIHMKAFRITVRVGSEW